MRVLLIRFSSIGDLVLCSPVIRALRVQTGCELHVLTKHQFATVLEADPHIHRIHTFAENWNSLLPTLRALRFDHVVDLHKNWRSLRVRRALGVPATSFPKLNIEKWLRVRLGIDRLPDRHLVDRYFEAVARLGVRNDGEGLAYHLPDDTRLPPDFPKGDYTAFAIGGAHATKRLPPDRLAELLDRLPRPVVLLGGPTDAQRGQALARDGVFNYCGTFTLHQSALALRHARRVYTHDTGMMHIAAAFQRPIVSFWGNTIPAFGMYPYYGDQPDRAVRMEVTGLRCRPCSKIGYARCPKGHFRCMRAIDFDAIPEG